MAVPSERRRFTVEEYERMAAAGILGEDDRVELIEGEIVTMSPTSSRHAACIDRGLRLLSRQLGDDVIVRVQSPIRLHERSEPEPDLALLRFRDDFYAGAHPRPEDILLVIEVAETSRQYDRKVKLPQYARAGIPEAWIFDLSGEVAERHSRHEGGRYRTVARLRRGQTPASATIPGLALPVDAILGAPRSPGQ